MILFVLGEQYEETEENRRDCARETEIANGYRAVYDCVDDKFYCLKDGQTRKSSGQWQIILSISFVLLVEHRKQIVAELVLKPNIP